MEQMLPYFSHWHAGCSPGLHIPAHSLWVKLPEYRGAQAAPHIDAQLILHSTRRLSRIWLLSQHDVKMTGCFL